MLNNKKIKKIIFIFLLIFGSYGYYFFYNKYKIGIPCVFNYLTGLYCPGCGITRMFFSIITFNFYQAFRYNPLVFIYLIIYIFSTIYRIINKVPFNKEYPKKITVFLLIVALIFGILRNVPIFYFLRPTIV